MTPPKTGKPRGVLRAPAPRGTFAHERRAPSIDLAPFVEHFWMVSWDVPGEPAVREVLPHPSVHVVFERGRAEVAGVPRGRFVRRLEGKGLVFGVKFRPGGFRPFVPFPVSRLTGRVVPVSEIFEMATEGLAARVLARPAMSAMIAAATALLKGLLPARDPVAEEVAALVRRILDDPEILRVEDFARICGRGPRALQRLFAEFVGVSPKWVIRRYRLHEALARVDGGTVVDWPSLALDLGYFDQAHFIRDFRTLVGRTPAAYGRRR